MNLIADGSSQPMPLPGAGLLAGHYYDPYPPRFAANLKELVAAGNPLIVRIHPGLRYPMSDDELFNRVDLEGHVALIVGFDHDMGRITFADPWNPRRFGGAPGGPVEEDEEEGVGTLPMNATLDYAATAIPLPVNVTVEAISETSYRINASVALRLPNALTPAVSRIECLDIAVTAPRGVELLDGGRQRIPLMTAGEDRTVQWTVRVPTPVHGEIRVAAAGIGHGDTPYQYSDVIGGQAALRVSARQRSELPI